MRFLALAASFNPDSLNLRLLRQMSARLNAAGHHVTLPDYPLLDSPSYSDARYQASGLPEGAARLRDLLLLHDAWLIAMPEYNWSMPGHLKNLIDWLSREESAAFHGKPVLLASASPSLQGGVKGLLQLKQPLEALGAFPYPQLLTVSDAGRALDADGAPQIEVLEERLQQVLAGFITFAARFH